MEIDGLKPFYICQFIANNIKNLLISLIEDGEPIYEVKGYRVGLTRGKVDEQGNRTDFSNHSYGVAIDINENANGLYENCISFSESCILRKGGKWNPQKPTSLTKDSLTVRRFKEAGFLWGGEILGQQKDFMHFSLTGY